MKTDKILLVDDDRNVLEAISRQLRKTFSFSCTTGGSAALRKIREEGPYAVVISDLRMPGMDGIELLNRVKQYDPDITRIILSGDADLQTAIDAVNTGQVFRFLTKPCSTNGLVTTLTLGLRQFELVKAERELINKTIRGIVNMLSELLSLANPRAFSRGGRVRDIVMSLAAKLDVKTGWQLEIAALLSQIGCIAVPEDILNKIYLDEILSPNEARIYHDHPRVGSHLVGKIPRLEGVADIIRRQIAPERGTVLFDGDTLSPTASDILRVALEYELLIARGTTHDEALTQLYNGSRIYHPDVLESLKGMEPVHDRYREVSDMHFNELVPGMIAAEDVYTSNGTCIISKNQEITWPTIQSLQNFIDHIGIKGPIRIWESG